MSMDDFREDVERRLEDDRADHPIWLEIRVSQGHDFQPAEEQEPTRVIERQLDVAPRDTFCQAERNLLRCFVRVEGPRVPVRRLEAWFFDLDLGFSEVAGVNFDELNVVHPDLVASEFPQAVGRDVDGEEFR